MKNEMQIDEYLENAEKAFQEKKLLKAIDLYNKVYELSNGKNIEAIINLAVIYDSLEKSDMAKKYYLEALAIDEYEDRAYYGLAVIYDNDKNYKKAIELYKKAIFINPNYHEAYFFLANAYDVSGAKRLAVNTYKRLLELDSMNFWANLNLGAIYEEAEQNNLAYKMFSKALEIEPENYLALFNMGVICNKFNMLERAVNFYKKSLKQNKAYEYSYLNLAVIYKYTNTKKGIKFLSDGINNCVKVHFLYYNRSCFYALINEKDRACEDIITALKLYPGFLEYALEDEELEEIRKLDSFKKFIASYNI